MIKILYFILPILLVSCGLDCIDKKTGLPRSSQNINDSKDKNVFKTKLISNKTEIELDKGNSFVIKSAWIEKKWQYTCIDRKAILQADDTYQLVLNVDYKKPMEKLDYLLKNNRTNSNCYLGSVLRFDCLKTDSIQLTLIKNNTEIDKMDFFKSLDELKD